MFYLRCRDVELICLMVKSLFYLLKDKTLLLKCIEIIGHDENGNIRLGFFVLDTVIVCYVKPVISKENRRIRGDFRRVLKRQYFEKQGR